MPTAGGRATGATASEIAAMSVGYTSAVPMPSATAAMAAVAGSEHRERDRLHQHAGGDQRLAADAIGPVAGPDLSRAPGRRVEPGDEPDVRCGCPVGGEEERHDTPGERVVQIVREARLRARPERGVAEGRLGEGAAKWRRAVLGVRGARL